MGARLHGHRLDLWCRLTSGAESFRATHAAGVHACLEVCTTERRKRACVERSGGRGRLWLEGGSARDTARASGTS
eukprot:3070398-Rhodomonas_salina.2